jgi:hypothetical protein
MYTLTPGKNAPKKRWRISEMNSTRIPARRMPGLVDKLQERLDAISIRRGGLDCVV